MKNDAIQKQDMIPISDEIFDRTAVVSTPPQYDSLTQIIDQKKLDTEQIEEDFARIRSKLYETLQEVECIKDTAIKVAQETGEPRALEVANQILKNMAEVAEKVIKLQKDKRDVNKDSEENNYYTQQNFIFTGTLKELKDLFKKENFKDGRTLIDNTPEDKIIDG